MNTPRRMRSHKRQGARHLPQMARECIRRLTRILYGCGISEQAIARGLYEAADELLTSPPAASMRWPSPSRPDLPLAHQLITEWCRNPRYTYRGKPRPLPKEGPRSMTSLARTLNRAASVDEVVAYLLATQTVERVGQRYRPRSQWVLLRGSDFHSWWSLRYTHATLGTAEHNLFTGLDTPARFERLVEHTQVPVSQVTRVAEQLERRGMALLKWFDRLLRSCAAHRQAGEATAWVGIALQLVQQDGKVHGLESPSAPRILIKPPRSISRPPARD